MSGSVIFVASVFEDWQPTLALRIRTPQRYRQPEVLEQLYVERQTGKREWRAVPKVDHNAPASG